MYFRATKGEKVFDVFNTLFMLLISASMLYPILFVVSHSLMTDTERALHPFTIIPTELNFSGYEFILAKGSLLLSSFQITFFRLSVGTLLSLIVECMFAYAISKRVYPLAVPLTMMIAFTMWFQGGLIPSFLVMKSLGFLDSIWVFVIPKLMNVWYILLLRNFFAQIPAEIEESAKIDGSNEMGILWRIILPLSTPVLATIALFHVVYHWNEWFMGIIYISDQTLQPAMVILRQILSQANAANMYAEDMGGSFVPPTSMIQMATIVVVSFPIIAAYPFFQKYFTKGLMVGAVKG
ncbi:carbohydrate ABC transporter permease [Paenibacillus pinihumi]|uniref:carbohydrate ABC transporter permease n=1 Tax=Paenibacillus pinihumi TaxID=669462 RepID=UPI00040C2949|nr:carbohydrate ABC transporter permease [Paenibacillus pinihumi]